MGLGEYGVEREGVGLEAERNTSFEPGGRVEIVDKVGDDALCVTGVVPVAVPGNVARRKVKSRKGEM